MEPILLIHNNIIHKYGQSQGTKLTSSLQLHYLHQRIVLRLDQLEQPQARRWQRQDFFIQVPVDRELAGAAIGMGVFTSWEVSPKAWRHFGGQ